MLIGLLIACVALIVVVAAYRVIVRGYLVTPIIRERDVRGPDR